MNISTEKWVWWKCTTMMIHACNGSGIANEWFCCVNNWLHCVTRQTHVRIILSTMAFNFTYCPEVCRETVCIQNTWQFNTHTSDLLYYLGMGLANGLQSLRFQLQWFACLKKVFKVLFVFLFFFTAALKRLIYNLPGLNKSERALKPNCM